MKKRIIALALCAVMLLSFTSCGIRIGGFSLSGFIGDVISNFTTVVDSENYSINIGMLTYYYYDMLYKTPFMLYSAKSSPMSSTVTENSIVVEKTINGDAYVVDEKKAYVLDESALENGGVKVEIGSVTKEDLIINSTIVDGNNFVISDGSVYFQMLDMESRKSMVIEKARRILMYCEYANAHGIELDDKDSLEAERRLSDYVERMTSSDDQALVSSASSNNPVKELLASVLSSLIFDEYDVITAIEYSILAEKGEAFMNEQIKNAISAWEIEREYENRGEYDDGNEEKVKDICYATFDNRYDAEEAIEYLGKYGSVEPERFIEISSELGVAATRVEEYYSKDKDDSAIDRWLYDGDRSIGELTEEPIYDKEQDVYFVVYYYCEGADIRYVEIRDELASMRLSEMEGSMYERYPTSVNYDAFDLFSYFLEA